MRSRFRHLLFGLLGFLSAIVTYFLTPGQWLNRLVAVALCTVLTTDNICLPKNYGQSVAATPRELERVEYQSNSLFAQRSDEFDDNPVTPVPSGNATPPPFPIDPGPNQPLRRPDFDDSINYTPASIPEANLAGVWYFELYESISSDSRFYTNIVNIRRLNSNLNYGVAFCNSACKALNPNMLSEKISFTSQPKDEVITLSNNDISLNLVWSTDNQAIWGQILEGTSDNAVYFILRKIQGININLAFNDDYLSSISLNKSNIKFDLLAGFDQPIPPAGNPPTTIPPINVDTWVPKPTAPKPPFLSPEPPPPGSAWRYLGDGLAKIGESTLRAGSQAAEVLNKFGTQVLRPALAGVERWAAAETATLVANTELIVTSVAGNLGSIVAGAIGAITLGLALAVGEFCINDPEGCALLAKNPGRTAQAIGEQIAEGLGLPRNPTPSSSSSPSSADGQSRPEIFSVTCNREPANPCSIASRQLAQMSFGYRDRDNNAQSWRITDQGNPNNVHFRGNLQGCRSPIGSCGGLHGPRYYPQGIGGNCKQESGGSCIHRLQVIVTDSDGLDSIPYPFILQIQSE